MDPRCLNRLTRAEKNPRLALERGWLEDPEFCRGFFDRCDHLAFVMDPSVLELSLHAVEIAERHGDPHLVNYGHGVLSHAFIARDQLYWAGKTLGAVRDRALACCPRCRSEHLRREGDLLGEERELDASLAALDASLEEGGDVLGRDQCGRICFVRGITHFLRGDRDRALADAGRTVEQVSLAGPRGFFLDVTACVPIFLGGGDPRHDVLAAAHLETLAARVKGLRGWGDLRTRMAWARAHVDARQGEVRRARRLFKSAYVQLLADGLPREAVAVTLDLAQLVCRGVEPRGDSSDAARALIERLVRQRPDLSPEHLEGLAEMTEVLELRPHHAFRELVAFRRSFIAPVPGVMAERLKVE